MYGLSKTDFDFGVMAIVFIIKFMGFGFAFFTGAGAGIDAKKAVGIDV